MSGRIRTVKPEFWSDARLARLSRDHRLFYEGLWTFANDHGKGVALPKQLAGDIFPHDADIDTGWVCEALDTLADAGHITLYEVEDQRYFRVTAFRDHQRVDRPSRDVYPSEGSPFRFSGGPREPLAQVSRTVVTTLAKGTEEQGSRGTEDISPSLRSGERDNGTPVGWYVEACQELGSIATPNMKARVGKEAKQLQELGFEPHEIRIAIGDMARRNASPTLLASIANDVRLHRAGVQMGRVYAPPVIVNSHDALIASIRQGRAS